MLGLALLGLTFFAQGNAVGEAEADAWADFRVTTFNLRNSTMRDTGANTWKSRFPVAVQMLDAQDAAILGFQEVSDEQRRDLDVTLSDYRGVGDGRDGPGRGEQCPVYFRRGLKPEASGTFWLSPTPTKPSRGWDAKMPRICTWVKYPGLTIFNTHLDFKGAESRREALKLIRQRISGSAIVMGDFNDHEGADALEPVADLVDAYRSVQPLDPNRDETTYHAFQGERHSGPRIDFIFVTPDLKPVEASIVHEASASGPFPSDHRAVTVRLQKR